MRFESLAPIRSSVCALGPIVGLVLIGSKFQPFKAKDANKVPVQTIKTMNMNNGLLRPDFLDASKSDH
eukprot:6233703-Ditylum_brightwellii.AAC.1